jgi:hypothetical protein
MVKRRGNVLEFQSGGDLAQEASRVEDSKRIFVR